MLGWIEKVLLWDEERDPAQAQPQKTGRKPWHMLTRKDRELLDALAAEDRWMHEDALRVHLGRGRVGFFFTTLRMVEAGWIRVRPASESIFGKSEYRLNPEAW